MDPSDQHASELVCILSSMSSSSSTRIPEKLNLTFCNYCEASLKKLEAMKKEVSSGSMDQQDEQSLKEYHFAFVKEFLKILLSYKRNNSLISKQHQSENISQLYIYMYCLPLLHRVSSKAFTDVYYLLQHRSTLLECLQECGDHENVVKQTKKILTNIRSIKLESESGWDIEKLVDLVVNAVRKFLISLSKQRGGLSIKDNDFKFVLELWVQTLCYVSYINKKYELPTWDIFSQLSTSKFPISQILEKEFLEYKSSEIYYPAVARKMQFAIIRILWKQDYYKSLGVSQYFRLNVRTGQMIQYENSEHISRTINYLTRAIDIGDEQHFENGGTLLCHELAVAYSLRAIAKHQDNNNASEDIGRALNLWMTIIDTEKSIDLVNKSSLCHDPLILLFYITDILALKSWTQFDGSIFKLLVKLWNSKIVSMEELLQFLWRSRRLGHALCVSPINDSLLTDLCCEYDELTTINFWTRCLKDSNSLLVGFHQKLYESSNCFNSYESDISVEGLKKICAKLERRKHNIELNFLAGYLYFDLCERLVASGQLYEAIVYGDEALRLRKKVYYSYFSSHKLRDTASCVIWSSGHSPQKKKDKYVSPWKAIQCFLESCLQIGTVWEMIGDDKRAEMFLLLGKKVAVQMNLPLFTVSFSCVLGKLYHGRQLFKLSHEELESATKIIACDSFTKACQKCKLVLEVSVDLERGDLARSNFGSENNDASHQSSSTAETFYSSVLEKLKLKDGKITSSYSSNSGILKDAIDMKWEMSRRRLYLRLLEGEVMCQEIQNNIETQQDTLKKSLAVLLEEITFDTKNPMLSGRIMSSFGSIFAVEIATVFYNLSWTYLKRTANAIRSTGWPSSSELHDLSVPVTWLRQAFTLCREVPNLFIKVSRLLSVVYILGTWKEFSCSSCSTNLSESQWAAYFHASSVGAHSHHMFSSSSVSSMTCSTSKELEPDKRRFEEKFEKSYIDFFDKLPSCTKICVSMIGQPLAKLLEDILEYDKPIHAWLLVSRLKHAKEPLVALLPVDSKLKVPTGEPGCLSFSTSDPSEIWKPTWGLTPVDKVAPLYKYILQEDAVVRRALSDKDKLKDKEIQDRRKYRTRLNRELAKFLRKLEQVWFGPWLIVLRAELSNSPEMDDVESMLMNNLDQCNITVNALLLKALLGARGECSAEQCIDQLLSLKKGCIIGKSRSRDTSSITDAHIESAKAYMGEALKKIKVLTESKMGREPIIFMPDLEVQMLPWESTPTLGEQEMYRVPNVCSIRWILGKSNQNSTSSAPFTWIDPLDIICVEDYRFEDKVNKWLLPYEGSIKRKFMEQKKPLKPGSDDNKAKIENPDDGDEKKKKVEIPDLTSDLKEHNFFVYYGHGGDLNKLVDKHLSTMDTWPACILMGCETGVLSYTGSYGPRGNPLQLLKKGSPLILSSLWVQIFGDMELYIGKVLGVLINERNYIKGPEFDPRPMFASAMKPGRDACNYSHSSGAAMVCYGLPAGLYRNYTKVITLPVKVKKTLKREKDSSMDGMEMGVEV